MATNQRLYGMLNKTKQTVRRRPGMAGLRIALTSATVVAAVAIRGFQVAVGASPSTTAAVVAQGKQIFRFDSFGDETL